MSGKSLKYKAAFLIIVGFALALALELTRLYVQVRTDPSFESVCALNNKVNCLTVAESGYSAFLGIPVSIWGTAGYLAMIAACLFSFSRRKQLRASATGVLFGLSLFAVFTSITLFYISEFVIEVVCPYCVATYAANLVLFILVVLMLRADGGFKSFSVLEAGLKTPFRLILQTAVVPAVLFLLLALPVLGFKTLYSDIQPALPTGPDGLRVGMTEDGHPWIGASQPLLTIMEFTDYECPHCRRAHFRMRGLLPKYNDQIRLVHRHLPLDHKCNEIVTRPFHKCACQFARYTVCATEQGKFWEMNDYLFNLPRKHDCPGPEEVIRETGLNHEAFNECLDSGRADECIENDIKCCKELGIHATPTYLCEDEKFVGGIKEDEMIERIKLKEKPSG